MKSEADKIMLQREFEEVVESSLSSHVFMNGYNYTGKGQIPPFTEINIRSKPQKDILSRRTGPSLKVVLVPMFFMDKYLRLLR